LNRKVEAHLGAKTLNLSNRIVEPVLITPVVEVLRDPSQLADSDQAA
jgi:hypothetical protein